MTEIGGSDKPVKDTEKGRLGPSSELKAGFEGREWKLGADKDAPGSARRERYCMMVTVQLQAEHGAYLDPPAYAWNSDLVRDTLTREAKDLVDRDVTSVEMLDERSCLAFCGSRRRRPAEGFTFEEVDHLASKLTGETLWMSRPSRRIVVGLTLKAAKVRLGETKAERRRERAKEIRETTKKRIADRGASLQDLAEPLFQLLAEEYERKSRSGRRRYIYRETQKEPEALQGACQETRGGERGREGSSQTEKSEGEASTSESSSSGSGFDSDSGSASEEQTDAYSSATTAGSKRSDRRRRPRKSKRRDDPPRRNPHKEKKGRKYSRERGHGSPRRPSDRLKLPIFKNEDPSTGVTYGQWRWQVDNAIESGYSEKTVLRAVIISLEGYPASTARALGKRATLQQVLDQLHNRYGICETYTALHAKLLMMKQARDESISDFAARMSGVVGDMQEYYPRETSDLDIEMVQKECFFRRMVPDLKQHLGHLRRATITVNELIQEAREVEEEGLARAAHNYFRRRDGGAAHRDQYPVR
ncbi:MAG: hypothetical protein MJA29_02660, partial [Candidatus Omnitrophica bacterium]|nr:hypothetical protein [Candidatus Omnitrophota bacterium]